MIRIAIAEQQIGQLRETTDRLMHLAEKLDTRLDRNDLLLARLMAGIAVAFVLAQVVAPYILAGLTALGAPKVSP